MTNENPAPILTNKPITSAALGLLAVALAGCEPAASHEYQGESLLTINGAVTYSDENSVSADAVPALLFRPVFQPVFPAERWSVTNVEVTGTFPSGFTLDVLDPPDDSALSSGYRLYPGWEHVRSAHGVIAALKDDSPELITIEKEPGRISSWDCEEDHCTLHTEWFSWETWYGFDPENKPERPFIETFSCSVLENECAPFESKTACMPPPGRAGQLAPPDLSASPDARCEEPPAPPVPDAEDADCIEPLRDIEHTLELAQCELVDTQGDTQVVTRSDLIYGAAERYVVQYFTHDPPYPLYGVKARLQSAACASAH